jgi:hypothetical protein
MAMIANGFIGPTKGLPMEYVVAQRWRRCLFTPGGTLPSKPLPISRDVIYW